MAALNWQWWPWRYSPTLSAVSPADGSSKGGAAVTLMGTDFLAGLTITFGSAAATSATVQSAPQITAIPPAFSTEAVNVTVTNTNGQNANFSSGFTLWRTTDYFCGRSGDW